MRKLCTLILVTIAITTFGQTSFNYQKDFKTILAKTKDTKDKLSYDKLLIKFKSNDTTMTDYEVLSLMIGFTDKPDYKPYDDLAIEREIYDLNGENKFKEALAKANKFLKTHPLSLKALFEKSYAFHKLDQEDSASYYLVQGKRIIHAMSFSGDGKSVDTPMFALGPADGQDYIHKSGADIGIMGDGRDKNGNFLDILEAKFSNGKSVKLYFIIQHASEKMFGGKSIEDELKELEKKDKKKSGK